MSVMVTLLAVVCFSGAQPQAVSPAWGEFCMNDFCALTGHLALVTKASRLEA